MVPFHHQKTCNHHNFEIVESFEEIDSRTCVHGSWKISCKQNISIPFMSGIVLPNDELYFIPFTKDKGGVTMSR